MPPYENVIKRRGSTRFFVNFRRLHFKVWGLIFFSAITWTLFSRIVS